MAGKITGTYFLVDLGFSVSNPFVGDSAGMKDLEAVRDKCNSTGNATGREKYIINSWKGWEPHFEAVSTLIFVH